MRKIDFGYIINLTFAGMISIMTGVAGLMALPKLAEQWKTQEVIAMPLACLLICIGVVCLVATGCIVAYNIIVKENKEV